jgi:D-alanyl-D-alanine carboxypeptidase (penicillin-binding protein 5/6)
VLLGFIQLQRGVPEVTVSPLLQQSLTQGDAPLAMPWPEKGSAAVSVEGAGMVGSTRDDRPRALASLVKVMTAYVVLKDHPLKQGEFGPDIQIQASDVAAYREHLRNGESVVFVKEGDLISEARMLQGLLIPSGNNLAYVIAGWSSGSVEAFVARMNEEAAALGMNDTHYDDPSGLSPASISTARDQLKLAEAAMAHPVFASIVAMKQTELPNAGVLYNVNSILGQNNIVGVKTGWTEEAGACFIFAADRQVGDRTLRIYGVVLGQDTLADAFASTRSLIGTVGPSLQVVPVVTANTQAASLTTEWGTNTTAVVPNDINLVLWPGLPVEAVVQPGDIDAPLRSGDEIGKVLVTAGSQRHEAPLIAERTLPPAPLSWRLTRR